MALTGSDFQVWGEVKGTDAAVASFRKMGSNTRKFVLQAIESMSKEVQATARALAPVWTPQGRRSQAVPGMLRKSIVWKVADYERGNGNVVGYIKPLSGKAAEREIADLPRGGAKRARSRTAFYAKWVEFGVDAEVRYIPRKKGIKKERKVVGTRLAWRKAPAGYTDDASLWRAMKGSAWKRPMQLVRVQINRKVYPEGAFRTKRLTIRPRPYMAPAYARIAGQVESRIAEAVNRATS